MSDEEEKHHPNEKPNIEIHSDKHDGMLIDFLNIIWRFIIALGIIIIAITIFALIVNNTGLLH